MEIKITLKITGAMNSANVYNLKNYNFFYYYTLETKIYLFISCSNKTHEMY